MIANEIFPFLNELSANNNRDWFNRNKDRYTLLKEQFDSFIDHLIPKIKGIDASLGQLSAKECVFRIYRDVRFSKNKEPYKTHFGAYISNGGRKSKFVGYYVQLQPGNSFFAAGAYLPEPEALKEIRYEIYDNPENFIQITENKAFKNNFGHIQGEKLKTLPKGFPKDFEYIELLKYKSFEVIHSIEDEVILQDNFEDYLLNLVRIALPYNQFFNKIIGETISNTE